MGKYLARPAPYLMGLLAATAAYVLPALIEARPASRPVLPAQQSRCKFMTLQRSHEMPQRYRLFVQWETLENHTKDFRESPDFHEWRKLVGHCFSTPPNVEHVTEVMRGF